MKQFFLFEELLFEWLEEKKGEIALSTYSKYDQLIKNHIAFYFKEKTTEDVTATVLKEFRQSLNDNLRLSNGNKRTIVMIINKTCERAFQKGKMQNLLYTKPGLSKKKPMVQVFSTWEQRKLERYLLSHNSKHCNAILLALYSGLRIGEICALQWKDIDFNNDSLTVTKTVQRQLQKAENRKKTSLVISSPKSLTSNRMIPLPRFMIEHFKKLYFERKETDYIFNKNPLTPLDPRTLQYAFEKVLLQCNISYKNFHCLRHTFATRCIVIGFDVKTLSEILGHADIKITMEYYFHSSFEYKKKQINKLKFFS